MFGFNSRQGLVDLYLNYIKKKKNENPPPQKKRIKKPKERKTSENKTKEKTCLNDQTLFILNFIKRVSPWQMSTHVISLHTWLLPMCNDSMIPILVKTLTKLIVPLYMCLCNQIEKNLLVWNLRMLK